MARVNKWKLKSVPIWILIILTALFFDFGAKNGIASLASLFVGEQEMVVRVSDEMVDGRGVTILYEGNKSECFEQLRTTAENDESWTYTQGEVGVAWTSLASSVKGAEIRISVKASPDAYMAFHKSARDGIVEIKADGKTQVYDLYKNGDVEIMRIYPFRDMNCAAGIRYFLHILLFIILFVLLTLLANSIYDKALFSGNTIGNFVFLGLLAFLFVGCFKDTVNSVIVNRLLPKEVVSFSVPGYTDMRIRTGDVRVGLSSDNKMISSSEADGAYYAEFLVTQVPEQYIMINVSEEISEIDYRIGNVQKHYSATAEEKAAGFCKIYPFADSMKKILYSILIYLSGMCLVWCWLIMLHNYLRREGCTGRVFAKEYRKPIIFFAIVFGAVFSIATIQYVFNIDLPAYMPDNAIGDQGGYWGTYIFKDGFFDFEVLAAQAPFRGYTNFFLSSISKVIGARLSIDPVKVYLIFPALAFAWFLAIILPKFYEFFMGRKPKYVTVVAFAVVFTYFYRAWITMCTMDFYTMTLFFAAIVYAIQAYRKESVLDAAIAGLSLSLMINMHYNFGVYMIVIVILYPVCILFKKIFSSEKVAAKDLFGTIKKAFSKRRIIALIVAAVCFLIVCIPQTVVNYKNDYYGLFTHDSEDAYNGHPVSWSMWNAFFTHGMILWPVFIGDDQTASMKTQLYENKGEMLHPAQAMDLYAESPVETVATLVKKTFAMFDYKSNVNYGSEITWRETKGLLFSFFNYFLLLAGLFVLIKTRKRIPWHMQVMCWLIFATSVAMNLASHVEQRSSMPFCVILYMAATYIFAGEVVTDKNHYQELCDKGFWRFIVIGEALCFTLSMALWA